MRRLQALETLSRINAVVFDKTGTLTHDRLELVRMRTREGVRPDEALGLAAALARGSLHPVSRALVAAEEGKASDHAVEQEMTDIREIAGMGLQGQRSGGRWVKLGSARFCDIAGGLSDGETDAGVHLADQAGWLASFGWLDPNGWMASTG